LEERVGTAGDDDVGETRISTRFLNTPEQTKCWEKKGLRSDAGTRDSDARQGGTRQSETGGRWCQNRAGRELGVFKLRAMLVPVFGVVCCPSSGRSGALSYRPGPAGCQSKQSQWSRLHHRRLDALLHYQHPSLPAHDTGS
jgi:hypothetical protein